VYPILYLILNLALNVMLHRCCGLRHSHCYGNKKAACRGQTAVIVTVIGAQAHARGRLSV